MPATKVPKQAKRVFKGVIFSIYQWPQKVYDGSTRTFEIAKRSDTVVIIPTFNGKIVATKQKQPAMDWYYSVPAGRVDPGETPRQTAVRELREETGLKAKKLKLWRVMKHRGKVSFSVHLFIAQDCVKVGPQELDGGEKIQMQLMTFDQFLKLTDHPQVYESELTIDLLRARLHPKQKAELKKVIFG